MECSCVGRLSMNGLKIRLWVGYNVLGMGDQDLRGKSKGNSLW